MKREKEKAQQALHSIRGRHHLSCYDIMEHAVDLAVESYPAKPSMKVIGREVAHRADKPLSPSAVSRAMSRAAQDIWDNGSRENLTKIYGHPLREQPTAQSVIYTLSEYAAQRVTYDVYPICGIPGDYTIIVKSGERSAAVAVTPRDPDAMLRKIAALNEKQVPLDVFLELYLQGAIE